jgi:malonate transporter and related proteins
VALDPIVSAVIPVFGLVLCGYLAGRFGIVGTESSDALNQFVYYFALPAMLFAAVARGSLAQILNWPFLGVVVAGTLACAALGFLLSLFGSHGNGQENTMRGLNASFGNTGYLGIPLVTVAYGEAAALPVAMATVATNVMLFAVGIVLLELFDDKHESRGAGIGLAIAMVGAGLTLPVPAARFTDLLAGSAGPAALFALGVFVSRQAIGEGMAAGWPSVVLKLVVHPVIMAVLAFHFVPLEPLWAKVAVVGASLPLGASAFVLAQRYKSLELETSCSAVLSTALSVLTVSAVMAGLAAR